MAGLSDPACHVGKRFAAHAIDHAPKRKPRRGELKRGNINAAPKAPLHCGEEAPTDRSEFFKWISKVQEIMTASETEQTKRPSIGRYLLTQTVLITVLLASLAYSVLHGELDLAVSAYFFDSSASLFPWRQQPVVDFIGRYVIWMIPIGGGILAGSAALASFRVEVLRPAPGVLCILCVILIMTPLLGGQIKQWTASVRPWTLAKFGGSLSLPDAFWAASGERGGGALPSVHTATALSLYSLYFAGWALDRPRLRWAGLAAAVAAGLFFGGLRIMQGAHFLSQTLWSAAYAWCLCSLLFAPLICRPNPGLTSVPATLFRRKSPG